MKSACAIIFCTLGVTELKELDSVDQDDYSGNWYPTNIEQTIWGRVKNMNDHTNSVPPSHITFPFGWDFLAAKGGQKIRSVFFLPNL